MQYKTELPKNYYRYSAVLLISLLITNLFRLSIVWNMILSTVILIIYMFENKNYVINNYKKIKEKFNNKKSVE